MGKSITQKIIEAHIVEGEFVPSKRIGIKIDQTLTQDATGTLVYLQLEAMKISQVKTELSVSYIDHNTIQIGFENPDDHKYLQTIAEKYRIIFSKPGNGICHQLHLERFGKPGKTLLGSDSHTSTAGGIGMIGIGAGGLDVAMAMSGEPFYLTCPKVIRINLTGRLKPWVSAKDVILKILSIFSTKGNVEYVFEYGGDGVKTLSVPERATIANMGTECGVITSVFPSDEITKEFLIAQGREQDWQEVIPDINAEYYQKINISLDEIVPLVACPHSPGEVKTVEEVEGLKVDQVCIGSCTNSSYKDLVIVGEILKNKKIHPSVSLVISPGSRQVLENIAREGILSHLLSAGARITEPVCGFCIGNSYSPLTNGISIRTSNRNFYGRSGTKSAKVYLTSPETAAVTAIYGKIMDPRKLDIEYPKVDIPQKFFINDNMFIIPSNTSYKNVQIYHGPNIKEIPKNSPMPEHIHGIITIKLGDKITTDHIIPAGDRMKYRSNIPKYSEYVFEIIDKEFPRRAMQYKHQGKHNIIVGGLSYGQGSSREHAAICPMFLGVRAIIAKSFERIHMNNLINFGIIPLIFILEEDYDNIDAEDRISIPEIRERLLQGKTIIVRNITKDKEIEVTYELSVKQREILLAGGMLEYFKASR
jgi:aconitate hydratase